MRMAGEADARKRAPMRRLTEPVCQSGDLADVNSSGSRGYETASRREDGEGRARRDGARVFMYKIRMERDENV